MADPPEGEAGAALGLFVFLIEDFAADSEVALPRAAEAEAGVETGGVAEAALGLFVLLTKDVLAEGASPRAAEAGGVAGGSRGFLLAGVGVIFVFCAVFF